MELDTKCSRWEASVATSVDGALQTVGDFKEVRPKGPSRRCTQVALLLPRWSPDHAQIGQFWERSLW